MAGHGATTADTDSARWMQRALELAARGRGRTSPNPLVGAVLVRDGQVVGEGYHERCGRPHAEAVALAAAGPAAAGAILYVTLEPCCHSGRTPPCVPALLAAGVAKVVTTMEDPDPRVAGEGLRRLRAGGVAVETGLLAEAARRLNEEYLHRQRTGRAFGVLKAAVTLDGRLAAEGGDSRWISGKPARQRAHELRDLHDGILVGWGTVEIDDPSLDVRLDGERRDPVAVVVTSRLREPRPRRLWQRAKEGSQVIVATSDMDVENWRAVWEAEGVELLATAPDPTGRVDLDDLFRQLADRGLNSVLVEGGERVHTAALAAGVIGRAHVSVAPKILGGASGPRLVGDFGFRRVADGFHLRDVTVEELGADVLFTGRVVAGEPADAAAPAPRAAASVEGD